MPASTVRYTVINKNGEICWNKLVVSGHAYKRARQRISWNQNALNRMTVLAYTNGLRRYELKGRLKHYTDDLMEGYAKRPVIRIYGEFIYIFRNQILVTIYQVPCELRKYLVFHGSNKTVTTKNS